MLLNSTPLYIGTSGYNHADWKGTFAPKDIDSFDLLSFYADKGFNFLELAFTFYRMPEQDKILHIIKRTENRVKFSIRLYKDIIHFPNDQKLLTEFKRGISPIVDNGLLECVYADYLPSFFASVSNRTHLATLRNNFNGITFFAELQNHTWYKENLFDFYKENKIGLTILDMPLIRGLAPYYPNTFNFAQYYKLYGKKQSSSKKRALDYDYSEEELKKFKKDAIAKSVTSQAIYIVFANVATGIAPKNAEKLIKLIVSRHPV
jgi:uncharacterized protein YecE (DUF72 family)